MNSRSIRFFHRGSVVQVQAEPTRTVLQWLREDQRLTGTKEGCAEGDCGACTVVVGELDAAGALQLRPLNACIQFLSALDGKALFTVEDLAAADGTLHPVQQALVSHHGSQCGFCTPGIAMSLWAGTQRRAAQGSLPSRRELADELSGNLCRCTGYRPILDAAEQVYREPQPPLDAAPVVAALQALRAEPPLKRAGWHAPRTLDELAALRLERPQALLLAGGTDIGLWVTKQLRPLPELIYLGNVAELKTISQQAGQLVIGAAAPLEDAWAALAAQWPTLRELWLRFASPPIRHTGTMGGNVANGSPIGDSAPVLMALAARIVLRQGQRVRRLSLEDFYTGYMSNRLEPGEFVQAIEVPGVDPAWVVHAYKISKRYDSDISTVCAALALRLDDAGRVADVRLAFGGMAATVRRAALAEAALRGKPWDEAAVQAAQAALARDFTPLTDMRASREYRMQVAQNLLHRWWLQTRPVDPLPESALSAFVEPAP